MGTIILIAIGAYILRVGWAYYQCKKEFDTLTPEGKQVIANMQAQRKAAIIADGLRRNQEYKRTHPISGMFHAYKPEEYYNWYALDTKRYPRVPYAPYTLIND